MCTAKFVNIITQWCTIYDRNCRKWQLEIVLTGESKFTTRGKYDNPVLN